jgi:protoporphyrinogen oxidase
VVLARVSMVEATGDVVIVGAGPAGLTAAYELAKHGRRVHVLEHDPTHVGGLSRTVTYKGFAFDIGGHRFFSKSARVQALWSEILPDDLLVRRRSSRIYYRGRFFPYPLKLGQTLVTLGPYEAAACLLSYVRARLQPARPRRSFEDWVSARFGVRLYNAFFKTYTEKVWGMRCADISADWAAQRIQGLSLKSAIVHAVGGPRRRRGRSGLRTLATSFRYPRRGPGMMWEACAERVRALGGTVELGRRVVGCAYDEGSGRWSVTHEGGGGDRRVEAASHVISSAPMRQLVEFLEPRPSTPTLDAAAALRYRDFLTVALILRERHAFDDQWIYVHDPAVRVARIQNFKAWSPEMVPDSSLTCYGLEYFCFAGDGLWARSDEALVELARGELHDIGLADRADVLDGVVVRQPRAYPVYDEGYADRVRRIRRELEERFPTLHLVGRNGLHRYNNQDHAMMTALLAAGNVLAGSRRFDVWGVNEDAEYLEASAGHGGSGAGGLRLVPRSVDRGYVQPV